MSPGINLPPQQPVIESELLFSLSGLSHYQKGCYFSSILSSRDIHCLAEMVQSTSSPTEFALALAFDLFTAHSMKTQNQKEDKKIILLFLLSYYLLSYILLLQFTPGQHLNSCLPHYNHIASWKPFPNKFELIPFTPYIQKMPPIIVSHLSSLLLCLLLTCI